MTRHEFVIKMLDEGHDLLFRDPVTMKYKLVKNKNWQRKIRLQNGVIRLYGKDASGWTVCKKPTRQ